MRDIIFLGAPGAGKGTVAKGVCARLDIPHISTGDMLRSAVAAGTALGKQAQAIMKAGDLVGDDLMIQIVRDRLSQPDCKNGFLLDGFPRTLLQAEALEQLSQAMDRPESQAILLEVDEDTVVRRISNRRICSQCGKVYNLITLAPKEDGRCDVDHQPLFQREDDREETVRTRFQVYLDNTQPLIQYYQDRNRLIRIDGQRDVDEVATDVLDHLER